MQRRTLKVSHIALPNNGHFRLVPISRVNTPPVSLHKLTLFATGLANITFAWMVEQCRPYLAFDQFTNDTLANYLQRIVEHDAELSSRAKNEPPKPGMVGNAVATITEPLNATTKWLGSFFSYPSNDTPKEKLVRTYCFEVVDSPKVKPHHWTFFRNQDSYGRLYQLMHSPENRKPGNCDDVSKEPHLPLRPLGETHEWMHPSVWWRQAKSEEHPDKDFHYKSEPLAALNYDQYDGVWGWKSKPEDKDKVWIPEWPIEAALEKANPNATHKNAELALIDACIDNTKVRKHLREHATAWNNASASTKLTLRQCIHT
jgi:hypothetical protein